MHITSAFGYGLQLQNSMGIANIAPWGVNTFIR